MNKIFTFKNKRHLPRPLAWLLAGFLRLYAWTFRVKVDDPYGAIAMMEKRPIVFAVWHNRVLFAAPVLPRALRKRMTVMISASRDGEYISTLVKCFGMNVVRGSSSRGGAKALLGLRHAMAEGLSPILTVDGPRGPQYTVHPGAVALACEGHAPLVPVLFNARHFWQLHSWDKMQIPWPFTRLAMVIGKPLELPEELPNPEGCEQLRQALLAITED